MLHPRNFKYAGRPVEEADKALIMVHGRGALAQDILKVAHHLQVSDFALIAPQAYNNSWYPLSFLAPEQKNQPWLDAALELMALLEKDLNSKGIPSENIYFFGFSQGACLTLEYVTRNAKKYGGVIALIGGLIGDHINTGNYVTDFQGTNIYLATSDPDMHVPVERVRKTAGILENKNAQVTFQIFKDGGHTILQEELAKANSWIFAKEERSS